MLPLMHANSSIPLCACCWQVSSKMWSITSSIRGTPGYWKDASLDLFAQIKAVGAPTFFITFSAADTRWDDLVLVLHETKTGTCFRNDDDRAAWLATVSDSMRRKLMFDDPVTTARHFDHRWRSMLNFMIKSAVVGRINDYFWRIEFQVRGRWA